MDKKKTKYKLHETMRWAKWKILLEDVYLKKKTLALWLHWNKCHNNTQPATKNCIGNFYTSKKIQSKWNIKHAFLHGFVGISNRRMNSRCQQYKLGNLQLWIRARCSEMFFFSANVQHIARLWLQCCVEFLCFFVQKSDEKLRLLFINC